MVNTRINQAQTFSSIDATTAAFGLKGGLYAIMVKGAWGGGSVTLHRLAFDDTTYIAVLTTAFSADGYQTVSLPQGTYKVVIATATAVYVEIVSIVSGV